MDRDLALIRLSAANGAQGIALQLEDVPPEMRTVDNFRKLMDAAPKWYDFIDASFLPAELKEKYKDEIRTNLGKLQ